MHHLGIALRSAIAAMLVSATLIPAGALADPPATVHGAEVSAAVHHDVSRPLRNLAPTAPSAANLREQPLRIIGSGANPNTPDGAVQGSAGTAAAATGPEDDIKAKPAPSQMLPKTGRID